MSMDGTEMTEHSQSIVATIEQAGFKVLLDRTTDGRYRVRISRKEPRYNVHTTSTAGIGNCIAMAHAKWVKDTQEADR